MKTDRGADLASTARRFVEAGLCALPANRVKKFATPKTWKQYQSERPQIDGIATMFASPKADAVCIVCGAVSGNLEVIDFDLGGKAFDPWRELVEDNAPGLFDRLVVEATPSGGRHVVYRCKSAVGKNSKLASAMLPVGEDGAVEVGGKKYEAIRGEATANVTTIETRGEGGLFLCDPSPGYRVTQGDIANPPTLTTREREVLILAARTLDESAPVDEKKRKTPGRREPTSESSSLSPGDDYNARGDIGETLRKHGWKLDRTDDRNEHWTRPGKDANTSATFNGTTFYVFSSSVPPFKSQEGYSKFAVYTLLEHGGDFKAAAKALAALGYGERRKARATRLTIVGAADAVREWYPADGRTEEPVVASDSVSLGFPPHLLNVPGFVGEVMRFNLDTATRPQPVLALSGALALQAVLAGRKVRDERGNRTNSYFVSVARTGAGKEHARQVNQAILRGAGALDLLGEEDIASDAGLIAAVDRSPATLFQLDEIGRLLRTVGDPRGAPHLFALVTTFLRLFSCAGSTFKPKAYGDSRRNRVIEQPCCVIHGTTTPDALFGAFSPDSIRDGFVGRLLIFETDQFPARRWAESREPPASVLDVARWWAISAPGAVDLHHLRPNPRIIVATPEARRVFERLAETADRQVGGDCDIAAAIWTRCEEKAARLALLYACSRDHANPVVDEAAADWACGLAQYLTRRMVEMAERWISDGKVEAAAKRVLRLIEDAGGSVTGTALARKTQWLPRRERREILEGLKDAGLLEEVETETATKPLVRFHLRRPNSSILQGQSEEGAEGRPEDAAKSGEEQSLKN